MKNNEHVNRDARQTASSGPGDDLAGRPQTKSNPETFAEFWPYYLSEHRAPATRALHFCGTTLALLAAVAVVVVQSWWWLVAVPVLGYGFAWLSHAVVERNRPASFRFPWWSLLADLRMWYLMLTGRMAEHLRACDPPADAE